MTPKERIVNALYATIILDSCGNPFEFLSNIKPSDVTKCANSTDKLIQSDDGQMNLFGFEAIHNLRMGSTHTVDAFTREFENSYVDWYETQTNALPISDTGLLGFPSMYSVQAPGNTCMKSCYDLKRGRKVSNDSYGCGSVMRLLPVVQLFFTNIGAGQVYDLAKITGNITHKHPKNDYAIHRYMDAALSTFSDLTELAPRSANHISDLGEGWVADECVEMAIWAYSRAQTFDELMELSIAHPGDSDSVGAVAGSLWGLAGKEVPQKYCDKLDAHDSIKYVINNYIFV